MSHVPNFGESMMGPKNETTSFNLPLGTLSPRRDVKQPNENGVIKLNH